MTIWQLPFFMNYHKELHLRRSSCLTSDSHYKHFRFAEQNLNPLSANPTKWSNTLKQFVGNLPTNCLSVFDILWGWRLKGQSVSIQFFPNTEIVESIPLTKKMKMADYYKMRVY